MPTKISIQNLNVYYKDTHAIVDLSLDINANQIMALIGPTKSGITTLLRSLNRLCELNPDARMEGDILIDGKSIRARDVDITELRRKVGMVFEVPTPLPMTIFDNVAYGLRLGHKRDRRVIAEKVEKAIRDSALWDDVKDRLNMPAMSLSGGQQQRLCIARILALEPDVILLDRPCSGLDPISTANIEDSLTKLKEDYTIIIAPHSVQQGGRIADRVAFLLMGELIEQASNMEIFSEPKDSRTSDYIRGRFG
ncbi:MAG: phosphate ABC transporter ATP-binding protein [Oscillospiraceae bacterium]|nr:phosphate ABC transporter ATP-binding protein [Oscillospiraceae bacterium]